MGLIREPKDVDFTVQSEPWTEEELLDFRKLMAEMKAKNAAKDLSKKSKNLLLTQVRKKRALV